MIKAIDFWKCMCDDLNYRFFSGVSCSNFIKLYNTMDPEKMHYIPAINEKVALNVVTGASMVGIKGSVLISDKYLLDLINILLNFNIKYKLPIPIICSKDSKGVINKNIISIFDEYFNIYGNCNTINKLKKYVKIFEETSKTTIIIMKEGDLK